VYDGDGGVAGIGLLHEQVGYRFTHNIATTDDHHVFAFGFYLVTLEQLQDTSRCG